MNPYSNAPHPHRSDLTCPTPDITFSPPSVPSAPLYPAPYPADQSEQLNIPHPLQTGQSELLNPYAVPAAHDQSSSVNCPALVQSESVTVNDKSSDSLSAGRSDSSDSSNPHRLSVVSDSSQIPDLECSICFSQFNNAFRCPKMLRCHHTFCLECLARMNVKSPEPSAIQCPLCRALTPLPALGLPKLDTDPEVLSCLPSAMQRVYSVRFLRNKGRLQLKRPDGIILTQSTRRSLDVGLPSPLPRGPAVGARGGAGGALFRLTGRPACRAFLLTAVILMIVVLTATVVFLLTVYKDKMP